MATWWRDPAQEPVREVYRCRCRVTYPTEPGSWSWRWQVTSVCPVHFRRLPLSVRVRILLDEGYRF